MLSKTLFAKLKPQEASEKFSAQSAKDISLKKTYTEKSICIKCIKRDIRFLQAHNSNDDDVDDDGGFEEWRGRLVSGGTGDAHSYGAAQFEILSADA